MNVKIIDLIHDTRHLCTLLRTDEMKVMSRGFSEGKHVIKFVLFILDNRK